MQKSFIKSFLVAVTALTVLLSPAAFGQGVVSSGISGAIQDDTGKPVVGAAVTVVHVPTNSSVTSVTGSNGRFRVSGLRVGGPYTVTATADGYTIRGQNDISIGLGSDTDITLLARSDVLVLEKFVTTGATNDLDAAATGAGSILDNRGINNMPTTNRSFADMMKTNPFVSIRVGSQVTALGMNNKYNSISIDGARQNDNFGLSSSGLFSLKNPFSLDALENFNIELTPYDGTRSGFAGASINAVSKSGTNEFHGSTYYYYTSYKWQGADVFTTTAGPAGQRNSVFYERTWGATLGGPIIKNKLFFFVNYEKFSNPSGGATTPGFTPDATALKALTDQFAGLPGSPDFGTFGSSGGALVEDEKRLAKLDWQITNDHRLSLRWSKTAGNQPSYPDYGTSGAPSTFPSLTPAPSFSNGVTTLNSKYYSIAVNEETVATQLFSHWSPSLQTEFAFSKNDTDSLRSTPVNLPEIILLGFPGASGPNTALLFGSDYSSMGNGIIAKTISYSGNATYAWKDFTFKTGFDREETDFDNLFRNGSYGRFVYNYTPGFNLATAAPRAFARNVSSAGLAGTDVSRFEQTGFFAQAKWEPNQRFNLMLVLRYDVLGSPTPVPYNAAFEAAFGIRNDSTIDGSEQFAPRVSFNYALDNDRKIQLRGGLGIFLGRSPWVWMSNSYGNPGVGRFLSTFTSGAMPTLQQYLSGTFPSTDPIYTFDPANPMGTTTQTRSADIALMQPGLKLPTNLRGNLAVDVKLPAFDSTFTVEYIHTDVQKGIFYDNMNLASAGTGADGRKRFSGRVNSGFSNVYRFGNANVGGSDYVAFALNRPFKDGWAANVTYTRGKATEAQPGGSSTAGSQWNFNVVFNQNTVEETRSDFEVRDRLQASFSKELTYFKNLKTTATLYYEGRSGVPFSYIYGSDLNGDGRGDNDAFAVPTGASDPRFDFSGMTSAQQTAYFAIIDAKGLSKYAGSYAPRNSFLGPWQNRLDLHLSQEVKVRGPVVLEVFADFINFGSWLSKDIFNYVENLALQGNNSNQIVSIGNATYAADGRIRPTVTLNSDGTVNIPTNRQFQINNGDSRWRIQAGARLKF